MLFKHHIGFDLQTGDWKVPRVKICKRFRMADAQSIQIPGSTNTSLFGDGWTQWKTTTTTNPSSAPEGLQKEIQWPRSGNQEPRELICKTDKIQTIRLWFYHQISFDLCFLTSQTLFFMQDTESYRGRKEAKFLKVRNTCYKTASRQSIFP